MDAVSASALVVEETPPPSGGARTRVVPRLLVGTAGIAAALLLWQVASSAGLLPSSSIPSMAAVASAFPGLLVTAAFWQALWATVSSWMIGLALTTVVAIPVGVAIGSSQAIRESTTGIVEFLKPIPPIALIPLGLLLWGPSLRMALTLVVLGAVWPLLTQVVYGIQDVDEVALAMARSYRLSRTQTITHVVLPGTLPFIATGMRVSAAIALIVVIVAEMVGGVPGLGQTLIQDQSSNALPEMYALIVVTGVLGLLVNSSFQLIERRVLFWHASSRGAVQG